MGELVRWAFVFLRFFRFVLLRYSRFCFLLYICSLQPCYYDFLFSAELGVTSFDLSDEEVKMGRKQNGDEHGIHM